MQIIRYCATFKGRNVYGCIEAPSGLNKRQISRRVWRNLAQNIDIEYYTSMEPYERAKNGTPVEERLYMMGQLSLKMIKLFEVF